MYVVLLHKAKASAVASVVVDVVDCNDNAPRFLRTQYYGRVVESVEPGSLVTGDSSSPLVLLAEDLDSALLQYDILEAEARRIFYIDSTTGKASYTQPLESNS